MNEQMKKSFRELVGESIGEASMCWSETPRGVFDSTHASRIVDDILGRAKILEEALEKISESTILSGNSQLNDLSRLYAKTANDALEKFRCEKK